MMNRRNFLQQGATSESTLAVEFLPASVVALNIQLS